MRRFFCCHNRRKVKILPVENQTYVKIFSYLG
nr:MAG TPA: hypothetical protein [Caudoviricetes sp.]